MYIKEITLKNFKSYEKTTKSDFGTGINFIVGNNNEGKTTILDAVDFLSNSYSKSEIDRLRCQNVRNDSEMYVSLKLSNVENIFKKLSSDIKKKYTDYIDDEDCLILRKSNKEFSVIQNGKDKNIKAGTLTIQNPKTKKFENPSGIGNAVKVFFDPIIIYAGNHNEEYQNLAGSKILGKLVNNLTQDFQEKKLFQELKNNLNKVFKSEDGIQKDLNILEKFLGDKITEQFGETQVGFDFAFPDISNIIRSGSITTTDRNGNQDVSEKGTGLQRALAFAVIQAQAEFLKNIESGQYLIDEPELFLHPMAQDKLMLSLSKLSKRDQIFITTHSPYILRYYKRNRDTVKILSHDEDTKKNKMIDMTELVLPKTSVGEIAYRAFGVPTTDLHQRLYNGVKQLLIGDDEYPTIDANCGKESNFEEYLRRNFADIITTKDYRPRMLSNSSNNGWKDVKHNIALPYIVRNEIDHPEVLEEYNGETPNVWSEEDLKESIKELLKIYPIVLKQAEQLAQK